MGGVKRMMEEVAERMGIDDPNDPRVMTEVDSQLSINHRRPGSMCDIEDAIQIEADQICDQRYGREFDDLPKKIQYDVFREAENIVREKLAGQAEMQMEERRLRGNGHGPQQAKAEGNGTLSERIVDFIKTEADQHPM